MSIKSKRDQYTVARGNARHSSKTSELRVYNIGRAHSHNVGWKKPGTKLQENPFPREF